MPGLVKIGMTAQKNNQIVLLFRLFIYFCNKIK